MSGRSRRWSRSKEKHDAKEIGIGTKLGLHNVAQAKVLISMRQLRYWSTVYVTRRDIRNTRVRHDATGGMQATPRFIQ